MSCASSESTDERHRLNSQETRSSSRGKITRGSSGQSSLSAQLPSPRAIDPALVTFSLLRSRPERWLDADGKFNSKVLRVFLLRILSCSPSQTSFAHPPFILVCLYLARLGRPLPSLFHRPTRLLRSQACKPRTQALPCPSRADLLPRLGPG
jgi:hypothetical protein